MKTVIALLLLFLGVEAALAQKAGPDFNSLPAIDLWPGAAPGGPGPAGANRMSGKGSLTNVSRPRLLVHVPAKPNGTAILVISGGGYAHIELGKESYPAAQWLRSMGITAFELEYRLPGENWATRDVPFQDAQRAMRIIRGKAAVYGIDPAKIGVLGFSAGGHLAAYIASAFARNFYPPQDAWDSLSARPDFCGLLYPVISMLPPNNKTHAFKSILGADPAMAAERAYSAELQVGPQTPLTFIAQAVDDPVSPVANSTLMADALKAHHIPVELHLFSSGGHGWGMGKAGTETVTWPGLFAAWMKNNKLVRP
ncbi:alpha/beta hydrolase [Taibaiella chishuiensis]|uniref:Acetyl esterase/lipase n=1 Tax=Taibaiella chishuiensis TaxID=1434707 RepID=A0A2P8CYH3_9BACT|nr:alpha/beta hydrolase [Taibaiella chishuiensis]PSK90013.1 acetyl esterase/lipase [Taibaiella chishuiensis]